MNQYPEHEKLHAVVDKSQAIGQFCDWLREEKGVVFCGAEHEHSEGCGWLHGFPQCSYSKGQRQYFHFDITKLLAEFFEIDLKKIEAEKGAMLEDIRAKVIKSVTEQATGRPS